MSDSQPEQSSRADGMKHYQQALNRAMWFTTEPASDLSFVYFDTPQAAESAAVACLAVNDRPAIRSRESALQSFKEARLHDRYPSFPIQKDSQAYRYLRARALDEEVQHFDTPVPHGIEMAVYEATRRRMQTDATCRKAFEKAVVLQTADTSPYAYVAFPGAEINSAELAFKYRKPLELDAAEGAIADILFENSSPRFAKETRPHYLGFYINKASAEYDYLAGRANARAIETVPLPVNPDAQRDVLESVLKDMPMMKGFYLAEVMRHALVFGSTEQMGEAYVVFGRGRTAEAKQACMYHRHEKPADAPIKAKAVKIGGQFYPTFTFPLDSGLHHVLCELQEAGKVSHLDRPPGAEKDPRYQEKLIYMSTQRPLVNGVNFAQARAELQGSKLDTHVDAAMRRTLARNAQNGRDN